MAEEFDYIIVGAGVGGCVLACRLTARDRDCRVLMLEAGDDLKDIRVTTPVQWPLLIGGAHDWRYRTTPQPGLGDRRLTWPRGRMVGGSTSMNAMVYVRGHAGDYASWAAAAGPLWGYDRMRRWFDRFEARPAADGPGLSVTRQIRPHPLAVDFVEAAIAQGLPARDSPGIGELDEGVGLYLLTQRSGRRLSAADAYLAHVPDTAKVTLAVNAHATRVLFEKRRAVAVEYHSDGQLLTARAAREVILAAGAIGSPHLLLLSGIGPADHLDEQGVPVVCDLPGVGRNLHDHVQVSVAFAIDAHLPVAETSNLGEAGGFVYTDAGGHAPDVQLSSAPMTKLNDGAKIGRGFAIGPAVARPRSRGRLTLASADPLAAPRIDPRYLSDPADLETLVRGVRLARAIADAKPLRDLRAPGPDIAPDGDDRHSVVAFIRANAETQFHPVGTCRMGRDERAAVDERLRVRGVTGLRVVDASVMPVIPTGNIQAATYAVAEQASELLMDER